MTSLALEPATGRTLLTRAVQVFGNQGFNSLANFALTVALVRILGLGEFGIYSLYYLVALNAAALGHALISQPAVSIASTLGRSEQRELFAAAGGLMAMLCAGLTALALVVPALLGVMAPTVEVDGVSLALLSIALLAPEFARRLLLFGDRTGQIWALDALRIAATALMFAALAGNHVSDCEPYIAAFAVANLGAMALAAALNPQEIALAWRLPEVRQMRRLLESGKWLGVTSLLQVFNEHFHVFVAGAVLGPYAVGAIRAVQNLVGLANPVIFGLEHLLPRMLGADAARLGEPAALARYRSVALLILGCFSLLMLALAVLAEPLLRLVLSQELAAHAYLLQAFCGIYVLLLLKSLLAFIFRYRETTRPVMLAIGVGSLLSLMLAWPLVGGFGLPGVLAGIGIAQAATVLTLALLASRRSVPR